MGLYANARNSLGRHGHASVERCITSDAKQRTTMSLNSLFDDPELSALVAKVEAAYGPDEIPRAIESGMRLGEMLSLQWHQV